MRSYFLFCFAMANDRKTNSTNKEKIAKFESEKLDELLSLAKKNETEVEGLNKQMHDFGNRMPFVEADVEILQN